MNTPVVTVEGVLIVVAVIELLIILALALRNIKVIEDNREITTDAIKGFQSVIEALNAIRLQIQEGDNSLMGKINDAEKKIYNKVVEAEEKSHSHLQYLRDKTK